MANNLADHPDMVLSLNGQEPAFLQRNKTERRRLQGLQRMETNASDKVSAGPMSLKDRFDIWMVNEGGKRIFFIVFVLLHVLVFLFGWFNYSLKDNLVTARSIFGSTFGKPLYVIL